ncbi:acyl transferase [Pseudobacter ginsenosidimutans]|uniref:Acyl-protein synthetase LuxE n=1 Tax=Pseudobacter ginsenosidimutans TaxID=661488 RepID=A0A4V2EZ30_9BACT|nr:acyl transferase [Pseudobacter ginsenosidimutans]QEC42781.1 acyl transferase [Pseudobacter ginsenosidimutans]RZS65060.1 acyl-protein synthetase LuxE [Pseudobacter ginsenosidimutans]
MNSKYEDKVFLTDQAGFDQLALELFRFQYEQNPVYREYVNALRIVGDDVKRVEDIPYLPIQFFKTRDVRTTLFEPEAVFMSSGTTQTINSRHSVKSLALYRESFLLAFEQFYGPVNEWCIIGLLPSYLERSNSSLVVMADDLVRRSGHPDSGFYLYEHEKLAQVLQSLEARKQKTLLIGVTFGLLDFAEKFPMPLRHTIIMETGGMKGRREEMTRQEVHDILKTAFGLSSIHSEYGMTELLSQGYSKGEGIFHTPAWMQIRVRQEDDPLDVRLSGTGIINVIDLANIYSCCFIATEDVGRVYEDGSFEVQGRVDNSDIRGCSLMVAGI